MKKIKYQLRLLIENNRILYALFYPIYTLFAKPRLILKKQQLMSDHAHDLLSHLDDTMNKLNIFYWLDCGTLLGVIREKTFITHDIDIDVSMFIEDYTPQLDKELQASGFILKHTISIDEDNNIPSGLEYTYEFKGIGLDIFFYIAKEKQMCYHYFMREKNKSKEYTINKHGGLLVAQMCVPNSGFTKVAFIDRSFNIPLDSNTHLETIYGADFMTPNSKWKPDLNRYKPLEGKFGHFTSF